MASTSLTVSTLPSTLAHVLLLLLNDVVGDGSPSVRLRRSPGKVGMVGTPVQDVWLTAGPGLVPGIFHENVRSLHLPGIRRSDLVDGDHSEPVLVKRGQVVHLDLLRVPVVRAGHRGPGPVAGGGVHALHDVFLDGSS